MSTNDMDTDVEKTKPEEIQIEEESQMVEDKVEEKSSALETTSATEVPKKPEEQDFTLEGGTESEMVTEMPESGSVPTTAGEIYADDGDGERKSNEASIEKQELEENVDEKMSKKDEDFKDFTELVKVDEESINSFELMEEDKSETPPEEEEEIKEKHEKKKKKKKTKKEKPRESFASGFSSLHMYNAPGPDISGDFQTGAQKYRPSLPSIATTESSPNYSEEEEAEEEETVSRQLTDEERYAFYAKYNILTKEYEEVKTKNKYLLGKLGNYYKSRKMFHVLYEGKIQLDTQKKYEKQLDEFDRITEARNQELKKIQDEVTDLRQKCSTREMEAQICFEKLQQSEYEFGNEMITSKAQKGNEEKIIERYLKRQKIQLSNLIKVRLDYIKIRNKVNETQRALDALDNFGPNLRLVDYEQLKHDNRNLHDKLEEKDLELTRVRIRCQNTMQVLAHRREKAAALDSDISYLEERLEGVTGEFEDVREQLNLLKQERDMYRSSIVKMKERSGLLSKPKLLTDMCNTVKQNEVLQQKLQEIRGEYDEVTRKLKNIRQNLASRKKLKRIKMIMNIKKSIPSLEMGVYSLSDTSIEAFQHTRKSVTVDDNVRKM